jgi:hypothetical protein
MPEKPSVFDTVSCVRGASGSRNGIVGANGKTDHERGIDVVLLGADLRRLFLFIVSADILMDQDCMYREARYCSSRELLLS